MPSTPIHDGRSAIELHKDTIQAVGFEPTPSVSYPRHDSNVHVSITLSTGS